LLIPCSQHRSVAATPFSPCFRIARICAIRKSRILLRLLLAYPRPEKSIFFNPTLFREDYQSTSTPGFVKFISSLVHALFMSAPHFVEMPSTAPFSKDPKTVEKRLTRSQIARRLLVSAGVAAMCGLGLVYSLNGASAATAAKPAPQAAPQTLTASPTAASWGHPANLADLVEAVSPAVVQITATGHPDASVQLSGGQIPDEMLNGPFGDFFKHFFDEGPGGQMQDPSQNGPQLRRKAPERAAIGSGFIISEKGYIVTNNHVVDGADKFNVALKDGREFSATLLGIDDRTDLAVLKIDTKQDLPKVAWGDSDRIRVGDSVFAVGAPFGLTGTVTAGIVSARGREIGAGPYDDFIQIDAPINQGNSGGPLFDIAGAVVGVNTAIFSPSGGNVGIGFAIPATMAQSVIAQIVDHGTVNRGWLGVSIQSVTKDIAGSLNLAENKGAIVGDVEPGSPAQKSGLKPGDVITKYNGKIIDDSGALSRAVAATPAGDNAKLTVIRDGREQVLTTRIEKLKAETKQAKAAGGSAGGDHNYDALGLALDTEDGRAVVASVDPDGSAADVGIQPGDAILSINQKPVASSAEAAAAIKEAKSQKRPSVLARVERNGQSIFVAIPFPLA
jgi:serine protease Do